jgi:hypothetical protein
MKSFTRKLSLLGTFALSFELLMLLGLAPTTYAISSCSATNNYGGYSYTISINVPCSGVALNTVATESTSTNNGAITSVVVQWYSSTNPSTPQYTDGNVGTPHSLDIPGAWSILATFYHGSVAVYNESADISVQILVLNELPLGTVAAAGIALLGFFSIRRLSKNFSLATPSK